MANLNPNLESRYLNFDHMRDEAFASVEAHCHSLKAFTVISDDITTSRLASIIRSKRNLSSINVPCHPRVYSGTELIEAISETNLRLETFRAHWCYWMNDDILMQLVESQIEAFNRHVLLTTLGFVDASATPAGLHAVLIRWRETKPSLPLTIECLPSAWPITEAYAASIRRNFQPLIFEFPEVKLTVHSPSY